MKKIVAIIGARPQFIKHFPLEKAAKDKIELVTVHTGQHYDSEMSQVFFDELGMSKPDYMLNVGSGLHGEQTGKMLIAIEDVLIKEKPQFLLVYGDTNSTIAGAMAAAKLMIPIIHVEAGLRSYNRTMPEEINRVLTDHLSEYFFVSSKDAISKLNKEGITRNIFECGDIMKDIVTMATCNKWLKELNIDFEYYYATIHRPSNTDDENRLKRVLQNLNDLDKKVIFPIHPRTEKLMNSFKLKIENYKNINFIKPQGYLVNLSYLEKSSGLVTDSGGMQKEAYWMKKVCVTLRKDTEWIETLNSGWNTLLYDNLSQIGTTLMSMPENYVSLYGDGNTANKIIDIIK
ncbi:non-hydrolyzing UDP-N-acetylglucosamine 2-epimerase [Lacihabitans sp. CS3-21]|uniref:non-hydrolyzing UDP-N-acetylglucosamine 2-epimerase n=1 Tax=Lacihabitans sp. CS3-21 TaxID=2487332 RepID=UPI0020CBDB27|nr:UDP-N-acetylglucosamine 2-epimerase (non-hydrolyzing) [Lacihabitans sp. CS3-21]MCP9747563.1 UDP-N-acetylglucosamine 2-epimerase (non-hydrolyzing) [Lacihabitans sp. CS3-21]